MKFKKGEIVYHKKLDGPKMMIEWPIPRGPVDSEKYEPQRYMCSYFTRDFVFQIREFEEEDLTNIKEEL